MDLRRLFLRALIFSLSATALLAVAFLLFAEFDDTTLKILATTALLSGFSLLGLPGGALLDQGRAVWLGWLTLVLAGGGLALALALLWTETGDDWSKVLVTLTAFTAAAAQASGSTARLRDGDPRLVRLLYVSSSAGGVLLAAMVSFAAWQEVEDNETFYRVLGAVAVAEVLAVLLQPILRRTGREEQAGRSFEFTITLDDGTEARRQDEAADFASAVASAIRELERGGRKVLRIERA